MMEILPWMKPGVICAVSPAALLGPGRIVPLITPPPYQVWRILPATLARMITWHMQPEASDCRHAITRLKGIIRAESLAPAALWGESWQGMIVRTAENIIDALFELMPRRDPLIGLVAMVALFRDLPFAWDECPDLIAAIEEMNIAFLAGGDSAGGEPGHTSDWRDIEDEGIAVAGLWLDWLRRQGWMLA